MPCVKLEFVGPVRRPWPEQRREVEVTEGTSVKGLLAQLGFTATEMTHLTVFVNDSKARPGVTLNDGDRVAVLLIVGGG